MAVGVQSLPQSASVRTSARASRCLAAMVTGYFVLTVIAGAPDSPMATPLPSGAQSPRWSTFLAERVGFSHLGRPVLTAISLLLMAGGPGGLPGPPPPAPFAPGPFFRCPARRC